MTRLGVAAAVVIALIALTAAGCSGDGGSGEQGPEPAPVALQIETVSGDEGLDGRTRADVDDQVAELLSDYLVSGFLGDYPRQDFVLALDAFDRGVVRKGARDLGILTASRFADAEEVRATRLVARLALLAKGNEVVGATAHVRFAFEATLEDGSTRPFLLRGRLMLENDDGTWSLFGYDVTRDDGDPIEAAVS